MKGAVLLALGASLLVVTSCFRREVADPNVPLVREILEGREYHGRALLDKPQRSQGNISIIGLENAPVRLAEMFARRDCRDNVDGRAVSDGLLDYAGETFSCISASAPVLKGADSVYVTDFRTRFVREFLASLDTVSHISQYDVEGLTSKSRAKIVILSDPTLELYGSSDVRALLEGSGCGVNLLCPFELMLDEVFSIASAHSRPVRVGIIANLNRNSSEVYSRLFHEKASRSGLPQSECLLLDSETLTENGLVRELLDESLAEDAIRPLNAIIIDDTGLSADDLRQELSDVISVMNESSITYAKAVSGDFILLDSFSAVSRQCYQVLRDRNLFTHNIERPQIKSYRVARKPDSSNTSDIILVSSFYVDKSTLNVQD